MRPQNTICTMMAVLALGSGVAFAGDVIHEENSRFAYDIDIPKFLTEVTETSENGDGVTYGLKDGSVELREWGNFLVDATFASEAAQRETYEREDGWNISYSKVKDGEWAVYSGRKGKRIVYARMVPACSGDAVAHFRLEYPATQKKKYDSVLKTLGASLRAVRSNCG